VALLHAVTDWYRVSVPRLLGPDVLRYLYRAYRSELTGAGPGSPVSAAGFGDAMDWATSATVADRPRLIDLQDVPGGQRYASHPLLAVIADDPGEDVGWPVADALWSYADQFFRGDQRRDIGYSALGRGACQAAARLLSHADTTLDPGAYGQIALLYYRRGDWVNSRDWFQQASGTSHPQAAPRAMLNLGALEHEQGDLAQARHWYQQAIGTGHPDYAPAAMDNLGALEHEQGDLEQARHWFQEAISTGHPGQVPKAMVRLGGLEEEQGDLDQARHWFQQAISIGHPEAMVRLGVLEHEQGDLAQARHWYQQAISTSRPGQAPKEGESADHCVPRPMRYAATRADQPRVVT
jgi:TPR repeat protein